MKEQMPLFIHQSALNKPTLIDWGVEGVDWMRSGALRLVEAADKGL